MVRLIVYLIVCAFTSIASISYAAELPAAGFEDDKGQVFSLKDFKGKVLIVNLWATWCGPCVREMPSLAALQKKYKDKGLVILALSEDKNIDAVVNFYKKTGIDDLRVFMDEHHVFMQSVKANAIPLSLIINKDGEIIKHIEGPADWQSEDVQKDIDSLLSH